MSKYDAFAATAKRLITDKGRAVSVTYRTAGTYSPTSDSITGSSTSTVSTLAVIAGYRQSLIDGTIIKTGDKKALLFAKDLEKPKIGDILTDNGIDYSIIQSDEVGPGDIPVFYTLQIRK